MVDDNMIRNCENYVFTSFVQHGLSGVLSTSYLLLHVSFFMAENVLTTQKVKLQIYNVMFSHSLDLWKAIHKSVTAIVFITRR
jgi:hypothetical protein